MNEHFAENMTGATVEFAYQPYRHGKGRITKITPRIVKDARNFDAELGTTLSTYEVFDLEIECEEGTEIGALVAGVPVQGTVRSLAGQTTTMSGIRFGKLYRAVEKGDTIVEVAM